MIFSLMYHRVGKKAKARHSLYLNSKNELLRAILKGIKNDMMHVCRVVNMQLLINYTHKHIELIWARKI